ncbi:MAG: hypothetical protein AB7G28_14120 [Pirellulales bacterium]
MSNVRYRIHSFALFIFAAAVTLVATRANASILFGTDFAGSYVSSNLGSPSGLPVPAGGLTLLAGDPNTLLIGGKANTIDGAIYSVALTRDAGGHITGFGGPATYYASAPFIDGGLAYGPGGVLFYTRYNTHQLGQIEPGSNVTDRVDNILGFGAPGNSVGSLAFVPAGFGANAGALKAVTYQQGNFGTIPLAPDGNGTFAPGSGTLDTILSGGPEGIAYLAAGSPGFLNNSLLVAEYNNGAIAAYDIDAAANPIPSSRREFLTGLTGAEGAFIDPLTGDFLFSTFFAGSEVFVVRGFEPPAAVPEAAGILVWLGLIGSALWGRRRNAQKL